MSKEHDFLNECKHHKVTLVVDAGPGFVNSEAWVFSKHYPVIGFEPCPSRYQNLLASQFPGELRSYALGSCRRTAKMYENVADSFVSLVPHEAPNDQYDVEVHSLDELFFNTDHVIALWADIEGSELDVLRGASKLIASKRLPVILLELREECRWEGWPLDDEVTSVLTAYDKVGGEPRKPPFYDALFSLKHGH